MQWLSDHALLRHKGYPYADSCSISFRSDSGIASESDILQHWFYIPPGSLLYTADRIPFMIIEHGRLNRNAGPDIKNAVLYMNGQWLQGDIECHIKDNSWYRHRHQLNQDYKHVILHIVQQSTLADPPVQYVYVLKALQYQHCTLSHELITSHKHRVLLSLAEKRWSAKVKTMNGNSYLEQLSIPLGAGGNEENFKYLLKKITAFRKPDDHPPLAVQQITEVFEKVKWQHRGIRPAQWPEKRLQFLLQILAFCPKIEHFYSQQPQILLTEFRSACSAGGKGIQTEILINFIFPLCAAISLKYNDLAAYTRWKKAWQNLELPNPYGRLVKKFRTYFTRHELCSVPVSQGLLYLEKAYCQPRYCLVCPLKNLRHELQN